MIPTSTVSLLHYLRNSQLTEISISPVDFSVKLTFTFAFESHSRDFVVHLFRLVHISFSKDLEDNEGCYVVYEMNLKKIDDGGKNILSLLNYPIKNRTGEVFSYPSQELYHFHLEGDMCIEVICGKYHIYESNEE